MKPTNENLLPTKVGVWAVAALLILSFISYHQTFENKFITFFDDNNYVTENSAVQGGLTAAGLKWAFTTFHAANWHPVTWVSHMADIQFFGNNPGWHHFTNILLHSFNTVLIFYFLVLLTSAFWKSLIVAALFSVHPLHVEAVAWVSERKELLGTFFGLLCLISYYYFVKRERKRDYILTLLFFLLSLLSKPMLITLPCLLLLLDFWPFRRYTFENRFRIVIEKLPLFFLSTVSGILTIYAQKSWGAVKMLDDIPIYFRLTNALTSYGTYLAKTIIPVNLAVFYPHTKDNISYLPLFFSALLLFVITYSAIKSRKKSPVYLIGWLWFLGTLFPVIGIIQVGNQAMADRYSYFPLTGIFLMVVWKVEEIAGRTSKLKIFWGIFSASIILVFLSLTLTQVKYWKNNQTLFQRAVEVTKENALAHNHLGASYLQEKNLAEAERHFFAAIQIEPTYAAPHVNLANGLMMEKNFSGAIVHYREALELERDSHFSRYNLGVALLSLGRSDEAREEFKKVLIRKPKFTPPYLALGAMAFSAKNITEAETYIKKVLALEPTNRTAIELNKSIRAAGSTKE